MLRERERGRERERERERERSEKEEGSIMKRERAEYTNTSKDQLLSAERQNIWGQNKG